MPELPEVEVIRRGLANSITGRKITRILCGGKRLRLSLPRKKLAGYIGDQEITNVERRAKYLLIHTASGAVLVIHLGMSGRLGLFPEKTPRAKHDHLRLLLDNGLELRFNDARRFGSIQVLSRDAISSPANFFSAIGPEPLGREYTAAYLRKRAGNRRQPVKNFLMDARVVAGIGNIYASEILFDAGLHPERPVCGLEPREWQRLVSSSRKILKRAIKCGGTTIADYVDASGSRGLFQVELRVYGKKDAPCGRCAAPIKKTVLAGRSSFFCPHCQS